MTSKQRAFLRGLAMKIQPLVKIGKLGITDAVINEINNVLEDKELIKISVLKNADFGAKDVIEEIAKLTKSQPVQAIGGKITLYRQSKKEDINHIELP